MTLSHIFSWPIIYHRKLWKHRFFLWKWMELTKQPYFTESELLFGSNLNFNRLFRCDSVLNCFTLQPILLIEYFSLRKRSSRYTNSKLIRHTNIHNNISSLFVELSTADFRIIDNSLNYESHILFQIFDAFDFHVFETLWKNFSWFRSRVATLQIFIFTARAPNACLHQSRVARQLTR